MLSDRRLWLCLALITAGGCYPEPFPHDNPLDPEYTGGATDGDGDGYTSDEDCDDANGAINPGATDVPYDDVDQDCSGADLVDVDNDGFDGEDAGGDDCDDADASAYPGADEIPYDDTDQDCDGADLTDVDDDGYDGEEAGGEDCDDEDEDVNPGADEDDNNNTDDNCNDFVDESEENFDDDGDGYCEDTRECLDGSEPGDCDDDDDTISPEGVEIAYNGDDEDCDDEDLTDVDEDGHDSEEVRGGDDCDDSDPDVYPGAIEDPGDGKDNNCNGITDEGDQNKDNDGDDFCESTQCVDGSLPGDCDDTDDDIYPGASEVANGIDDDCDEEIDEDLAGSDLDEDGWCAPDACSPGEEVDCNDTNADIHPEAVERCDLNGVDENCDGSTEVGDQDGTGGDDCTDDDGDGFVEAPASGAADCDDDDLTVNPEAGELADGVDNDCDGLIDEGTTSFDDDGDGFSEAQGDCDDSDAAVAPGATELCDGKDNDCDEVLDDIDADGIGGSDCTDDDSDGYSEDEGDCDDTNADIAPNKPEIRDGKDQDCSGRADDGLSFGTSIGGDGQGGFADNIIVGSLTGDGTDQVVVRARTSATSGSDEVVILSWAKASSAAEPSAVLTIQGTEGSGIGTSGVIADLDGNDTPDLVLGVPGEGWVCIYLDLGTDLDGQTLELGDANTCMEAETDSDGIGERGTLAAADLDLDGVAELIIGAPTAIGLPSTGSGIQADGGRVYVFAGLSDWEQIRTVKDAPVIYAGMEGEQVGLAVNVPGDVDGDGANDLLFASTIGDDAGVVVVAYGDPFFVDSSGPTTYRDPAIEPVTWLTSATERFIGLGTMGDLTLDGAAEPVLISDSGGVRRFHLFYGATDTFEPPAEGEYNNVEVVTSDSIFMESTEGNDLGSALVAGRWGTDSDVSLFISDVAAGAGDSGKDPDGRVYWKSFPRDRRTDAVEVPQITDYADAWWEGGESGGEAGSAVGLADVGLSSGPVLLVGAPGASPSGLLHVISR